jgi:hypothetical protein
MPMRREVVRGGADGAGHFSGSFSDGRNSGISKIVSATRAAGESASLILSVHDDPSSLQSAQQEGPMSIPRFLLLCLVLSALVLGCVSSLAAQSALYKYPTSSSVKSQLAGLVTPPDFRAHADPLPPGSFEKMGDLRTTLRSEIPLASDKNCFVMRSYQVKRDNPHSDVTRAVGYTECQPATRYQVRVAVESREIVVP